MDPTKVELIRVEYAAGYGYQQLLQLWGKEKYSILSCFFSSRIINNWVCIRGESLDPKPKTLRLMRVSYSPQDWVIIDVENKHPIPRVFTKPHKNSLIPETSDDSDSDSDDDYVTKGFYCLDVCHYTSIGKENPLITKKDYSCYYESFECDVCGRVIDSGDEGQMIPASKIKNWCHCIHSCCYDICDSCASQGVVSSDGHSLIHPGHQHPLHRKHSTFDVSYAVMSQVNAMVVLNLESLYT